jgi:hypothetical protein
MDQVAETQKKDEALNSLARTREQLITEAKAVAREIALTQGKVTSTEVLDVLRKSGLNGLNEVDPRFMGVVFREGWVKTGYVNNGSHRRPVSVWKLA